MVGHLGLVWVGTLHPRMIVFWGAKRRSVDELARMVSLKRRKQLGMRAASVYAPKYEYLAVGCDFWSAFAYVVGGIWLLWGVFDLLLGILTDVSAA